MGSMLLVTFMIRWWLLMETCALSIRVEYCMFRPCKVSECLICLIKKGIGWDSGGARYVRHGSKQDTLGEETLRMEA